MDYFVDAYSELGSDRNSGTHRRSPRKTLAGAMALSLKPKDRLFIRMGGVFDMPLVWPFNGVTVTSYTLGTEPDSLPTLRLPAKNVVGIAVNGKGNTFEHLKIEGAETHIKVMPAAIGNTFQSITMDSFGFGYLVYASNTQILDATIKRGVMVRNVTSEDYVGASAITLWKEVGFECSDISITNVRIDDAWAARVSAVPGKDTDGDGSAVEIFGGVKNVIVSDLEGRNNKILVEMGGTKARKETISNIRFVRCTTSGPSGKMFYMNDPEKTFGVGWEGVSFDQCTFDCDGYPESPVFLAGNHGNLSKKLSITNSTITAAAQFINAGKGTDLNSFMHSGNTFIRSDGSKAIGFTLDATDRFETR